ncbi:MAG: chromosome partitioning protein ParB [Planctomycetaceae bacterium]|nr:chromosome partitioning protein ParB [Planctomycetaceae bacterium]
MSTRSQLEKARANLDESIGLRSTNNRPQLSPVARAKDVGRRANRNFGRIEIDRVQPDPDQPRVEFDSEALQNLTDSIREKGQLAPIRVRWSEEQSVWLIISGERRWRACKEAGLTMIDCNFQESTLTPTQILEEQLIENLLRVDLKPIEEAESFQKLMSVNDWNGKQLATALNISPTRVSRALALLKLPHETRVRIDNGEISSRAGYELSKLPEPELQAVTQATQNVTIEQASQAVSRRRKEPKSGRGIRQTFIAESGWRIVATSNKKGTYHDIEQALTEALEEVRLRIDNRIKLT